MGDSTTLTCMKCASPCLECVNDIDNCLTCDASHLTLFEMDATASTQTISCV